MGELHLEIIVDRLKREFSVEATVGKPQVAYKETLTRAGRRREAATSSRPAAAASTATPRFTSIPASRAPATIFENEIVGGAIPKEFIKPIDEGIKEALTRGVLAGYPVDDVKIELYDGSYHDVDSSEMAFKIAGSMAFQDAAKRAKPVLLEPVMRVEVVVPEGVHGRRHGQPRRAGAARFSRRKTAAARRSSRRGCRCRRCSATRPTSGRGRRGARPTRCTSIATSRRRRT